MFSIQLKDMSRQILSAAVVLLFAQVGWVATASWAMGTDSSGGGPGSLLDLPVEKFEALVREQMPEYSMRAGYGAWSKKERRLNRQIVVFSYLNSKYRWSDCLRCSNGQGMREAHYREQLKKRGALGVPTSKWDTVDFAYFGAISLPITKTNYTHGFLKQTIRLLVGITDPNELEAKTLELEDYFYKNQFNCDTLGCFQMCLEEQLGMER